MDIQKYLAEMEIVKARAGRAIQIAQRRLAMRDEMQELSDDAENPNIAMDATQKAALVANQLGLTEGLDIPLAAAKAALA